MKAVITLLILGLLFIQGEALRCRQSSGTVPSSREVTCTGDKDLCFATISTIGFKVYLTRGCTNLAHCNLMKALFPSTSCCSTNLCN